MRLLSVWAWESLENLPMILGFVIAARLWEGNFLLGVVVLIVGMGLGVLVTRLVEPKLHIAKHEVRWTSVLINFVLFLGLAIPFLYYFRADSRWLNWRTVEDPNVIPRPHVDRSRRRQPGARHPLPGSRPAPGRL